MKDSIRRKAPACIVLLLLFSFSFISLSASTKTFNGSSQNVSNSVFSIIQISDTQYLTINQSHLFTDLTKWIAANSQIYNVKMVIHTGDIVDNGSAPVQWERANASMSVLLAAGVPYCWDAGNHDTHYRDPTVSWIGNDYAAFNPEVMNAKLYWIGDILDGKNTAVKFTAGDYSFLVVNLEFQPNSTVLNWMNSLITAYNTSNVILATHSYQNYTGVYDAGSETELFNALNNYPNVFLTLSGHVYPNGTFSTRVGNREEILFDRQDADGGLGAASARIITFNLQTNTANVSTYLSCGSPGFLNDSANKFSFAVNLQVLPREPLTRDLTVYWVVGGIIAVISVLGCVDFLRQERFKRRKH